MNSENLHKLIDKYEEKFYKHRRINTICFKRISLK